MRQGAEGDRRRKVWRIVGRNPEGNAVWGMKFLPDSGPPVSFDQVEGKEVIIVDGKPVRLSTSPLARPKGVSQPAPFTHSDAVFRAMEAREDRLVELRGD